MKTAREESLGKEAKEKQTKEKGERSEKMRDE